METGKKRMPTWDEASRQFNEGLAQGHAQEREARQRRSNFPALEAREIARLERDNLLSRSDPYHNMDEPQRRQRHFEDGLLAHYAASPDEGSAVNAAVAAVERHYRRFPEIAETIERHLDAGITAGGPLVSRICTAARERIGQAASQQPNPA